MLNRSVAPDFSPIKGLTLIQPELKNYDNGMKAFVFQAPQQELLKFEFVFNNIFEAVEQPLFNTAMSAMLKEGTASLNSAGIAEKIDFYGAYLMPEYSLDHTSLTVYTMHKYVDRILPIVSDILQNSLFPTNELDTFVRNSKQALQIALQKNDVVARRVFYQQALGNNRYGAVPTLEGYDALDRADLLQLYQQQIQPANCTLFVAGNVDAGVLEKIQVYFGEEWQSVTELPTNTAISLNDTKGKELLEQRSDALQSAVRMGRLTVNRTHPDFPAVQFVNTLLGGFFGSRLMRNIREDKGYTYSIGSAVHSLKYTGLFTLASEVGVDVTQATLTEVENEFDALRQEKTTQEEIDLVSRYLQGVMLGSLESIFSHVDKFKAVYLSGMDLSYYDYYADVVANMTASQVQDIAIRYFDYGRLVRVVAGKKG
ncbi:insulinase family protein [Sphingobacterium sp. SGG-5]|uniref:M16 family metallopeptidase n=1 Tax=Sphingobacterium sp. SGG-5 TaxID=2710881 RepID=UPI0013ECEB03|nr:pitrilysin family protein [Sphingobacterium sp. SGG-5]NGM62057.1 insulinase family protein [Sphingobacterium sp. SGG-5]